MNLRVGILGLGIYLPERIIPNHIIEQKLGLESGWIEERSGIKERRLISDNEQVSDLAYRASMSAIEDAGIDRSEIGYIFLSTSSPEYPWPATACLLQAKLGIKAACIDLNAVCAGFTAGLDFADGHVKNHKGMKVLLVCSEAFTRMSNPKDKGTYPLFGDGTGAVILGPVEEPYGIIGSLAEADGTKADILKIPAGGSKMLYSSVKTDHMVYMEGSEVFRTATRVLPPFVERLLKEYELSTDDIKYFVFHQANQRILDIVAKKIGLKNNDRVFSDIGKYGNTSSASIPIALYELYRGGKLQKGDLICTVGFGAGMTWSGNIICWNLDPMSERR